MIAFGSFTLLVGDVSGPRFAPGRAISTTNPRVMPHDAPNTTQIFLYDGRNDLLRQLTSLGARATDVPLHPTISGDGSRVAFATRRSVVGGNPDASGELYVYDIPTRNFARVTNAPAGATAEVVSSLDDDGAVVVFSFPRVLSDPVSSADYSNNSEIYVAAVAAARVFIGADGLERRVAGQDCSERRGAGFDRRRARRQLRARHRRSTKTF